MKNEWSAPWETAKHARELFKLGVWSGAKGVTHWGVVSRMKFLPQSPDALSVVGEEISLLCIFIV